jgi:hypothetical protein
MQLCETQTVAPLRSFPAYVWSVQPRVNYTHQTPEDKDRRITKLQFEVTALKHALQRAQMTVGERIAQVLGEYGITGKVCAARCGVVHVGAVHVACWSWRATGRKPW